MKLSQLGCHHQDNKTDRLYQPLRKAIRSFHMPPPKQPTASNQHPPLRTQIKRSYMDIAGVEPNVIIETTLFPQNMRLVQTNNPLKRFKARSRSYRAISVEQRVGSPIPTLVIQHPIHPQNYAKREIVYDYEPGEYEEKKNQEMATRTAEDVYYQFPIRARSATSFASMQIVMNRVEKAYSKTSALDFRQQNKQISDPSTKASIQLQQQLLEDRQRMNKKALAPHRTTKKSDNFVQYYQECKRYTFDSKLKATNKGPKGQSSAAQAQLSPRKNGYKYNVFSVVDQQANTNCANGFCPKNEIITPKIRQRW